MDTTKLIAAEIGLINRMLVAHGVQARALQKLTMSVKSSFIAYGLQVAPGESLRKVEAIQRELSNELTRQRVRLLSGYAGRCVVRLRDYPLAIEVPHPAPSLLSWQALATLRTGRFMGLIGRSYSYTGAREEWLNLERDYHTLIAAMSGGGKSTLMRMALLTLTFNTSPADLRVLLVDMKNDDLTPFQALPHCIRYAGDPDSAAAAIEYVYSVKTERIASQDKPFRLLMVIDELAELGAAKETLRQLGSILSTGRSLGINVWAGTQYPSAAAIGSIVAASFTTRLVGMVDGKTSALVATKRAGSGAEHLVTPGDFLRVDGQDLVRMKSYHISQEDTAMLINRTCERWAGQRVEVAPTPTTPTPEKTAAPTIPDVLLPIFQRFTDDGGNLQRGAMAAALRALFGDGAPTSGKRYQVECEKVAAQHKEFVLSSEKYFTSLHHNTSLSDSHTRSEVNSAGEVKYSGEVSGGKILRFPQRLAATGSD